MIRLRPHHLLCMLTYAGKGYSPFFIANFDGITRRLASGHETIEVIDGPDDVCAPLMGSSDHHCTQLSVQTRDRHAAAALSDLLGQAIAPGSHVSLTCHRLDALRAAFATGTIRRACEGCQWNPLCDQIAQQDFAGTRLLETISPGL